MENQLQKINILFWLFKSRGNEFGAPLRCRVSILKQRYEISLNYNVPFKLWITDWKIQCKMPPKTKKILPPENIQ